MCLCCEDLYLTLIAAVLSAEIKQGFFSIFVCFMPYFSSVDALITQIMMHCHDFYGYRENLLLAYHKVKIVNINRMYSFVAELQTMAYINGIQIDSRGNY